MYRLDYNLDTVPPLEELIPLLVREAYLQAPPAHRGTGASDRPLPFQISEDAELGVTCEVHGAAGSRGQIPRSARVPALDATASRRLEAVVTLLGR